MEYNYDYIYSFLKNFNPLEGFSADSDYTWEYKDFLNDTFDIKVRMGCTKFVCFLENENYVVKIPFDTIIDDEEVFSLVGASGNIEDELWDYCAREVFLYESAKGNDLGFVFPETQYIGMINHWPIYIQEKCQSVARHPAFFRTTEDKIKTVTNEIKAANKKFSIFNEQWLTKFYEIYGKETTCKLLEFIKFYHITDLHSSNVGFSTLDYRPVLIDFSGFYEKLW